MTRTHPEAAAPGRVAFFGHDRIEPTIRKRVGAIRDTGWSVVEYMFVRARAIPSARSGSRLP